MELAEELLVVVNVAGPVTSHDRVGAGTPNAVHWSSAVLPTATSGPAVNTSSVTSGGSAQFKRGL